MVGEDAIGKIFDVIRNIKKLHRSYADKTKSAPANYVELCREIWGYVTSHRYEDVPINVDKSSQRLMLAAIIAERFMLRKIRNLWKHVTVSIVGLGGSGKTTYATISAYGAMRICGMDPKTSIDLVASLTFFSANDFVKAVKNIIEKRIWVPFIILDDVGAQISKYWIFLGQHFWAYLFSILDQLKDWCGTLIITARNFTSIPARLREITDLVIEAKEVDIQGVVLNVFKFYLYDDYTSKRRREKNILAVDVMPPVVKMPQSLWERMIEIRRSTGLQRISVVEKMLELHPKIEELKVARLIEKVEKGLEELSEEEKEEAEEEKGENE